MLTNKDVMFQIPQGQSSNQPQGQPLPQVGMFQIPQGQSSNLLYNRKYPPYHVSNPIGTKFKPEGLCNLLGKKTSFKSHRDKVQTYAFFSGIVYLFEFQIPQGQSSNNWLSIYNQIKGQFQIPQGQSSNRFAKPVAFLCIWFQIPQGQSSNQVQDAIKDITKSFKSHRDKVQTSFIADGLGKIYRFKSHRDKVQTGVSAVGFLAKARFKSHRDKVQTSTPYQYCWLWKFQIPQGQSSNE